MNERNFGYSENEIDKVENNTGEEKTFSRRKFLEMLGALGITFLIGNTLGAKEHIHVNNDNKIEHKETTEERCEKMRQAAVEVSIVATLRSQTFQGIEKTNKKIEDNYGAIIKDAAKKYQVNEEMLKALIFLESNGDCNRKNDIGAVGLCQFLPDTARAYDLVVNKHIDERLNPKKSIYAACRFLSGHEKLYGNKDLAIETYHIGAGNMADLISLYLKKNTTIADFDLADSVKKNNVTYPKIFFTCNSQDKIINNYAYIENGKKYYENTNVYNIFEKRLKFDNAPIYLWRVHAIMRILRELKNNPIKLEQDARRFSVENIEKDVLIKEQIKFLKERGFNNEQINKLRLGEQFNDR